MFLLTLDSNPLEDTEDTKKMMAALKNNLRVLKYTLSSSESKTLFE